MFSIHKTEREAGTALQWWDLGLSSLREGDPFAAHEHWEAGWKQLPLSPRRTFLQGLIQIAGSFVLIEKNRLSAADRLAQAGRDKLTARGLNYAGRTYADFTELAESIREYA